MNVDLHRALSTLADGGPRRAAPTNDLLTRVRRRRTARAVATAAVSMGTVAAVAIGAMALSGRAPTDARPAITGATRTPTGDPHTTSPTPGQEPIPQGGALNCGDSAPETFVGEVDGVGLDVDLPSTWMEDDALSFPGQVDATGDAEALIAHGLVVALMSEGTVRASGGTTLNVPPAGDGRLAVGTPFVAEILLEPCGGQRLPAGEYTAVATLFYQVDDGREGTLQVTAPITVVAWTVDTAAEAAAEAAVANIIAASPAGAGGEPGTCGSTLAPGAFQDTTLRTELSMTAMPQHARPQSFYPHSSVENIGSQTVEYVVRGVDIVLTRGGVVVAAAMPPNTGGLSLDPNLIEPGSSWGLAGAAWFEVCALPGAQTPDVPLPAGDYQAWVVLRATVTDVDGPAAGTTREVTVLSQPVDVTYT